MSTELSEVIRISCKVNGDEYNTGAHYLLGYLWAWLPDEKKEAIVEIFRAKDNNE